MRRIYEADDGIRKVKLQILEKLRKLAAYACRESGRTPHTDSGFFYRALSYVGCDLDEADLLELLDEAEKIEHNIKSGGIQNDQEDYKN